LWFSSLGLFLLGESYELFDLGEIENGLDVWDRDLDQELLGGREGESYIDS